MRVFWRLIIVVVILGLTIDPVLNFIDLEGMSVRGRAILLVLAIVGALGSALFVFREDLFPQPPPEPEPLPRSIKLPSPFGDIEIRVRTAPTPSIKETPPAKTILVKNKLVQTLRATADLALKSFSFAKGRAQYILGKLVEGLILLLVNSIIFLPSLATAHHTYLYITNHANVPYAALSLLICLSSYIAVARLSYFGTSNINLKYANKFLAFNIAFGVALGIPYYSFVKLPQIANSIVVGTIGAIVAGTVSYVVIYCILEIAVWFKKSNYSYPSNPDWSTLVVITYFIWIGVSIISLFI